MRRLLSLLAVLGLTGVAGCGMLAGDDASMRPAGAGATTPTAGAAPTPGDTVSLAVYLRAGEGPSAHLERVTRSVDVDGDLPRRALEMLVAGPSDEEAGLVQTLPATTQVRSVEVSGGTAHVVLSPEVVRDASAVGDSSANEALALAAIANTLTEFASVEQVLLEVEGQGIAAGEFWGGWDLPAVLVRDEALVGAARGGEGVPDLGRFSQETQRMGSDDAPPTVVTSVRVLDRLTHVRLTVELSDPEEPDARAKIPRVRARTTNDSIVIDLSAIDGVAADVEQRRILTLSDPTFHELRVEYGERHSAVRILVDDARARRFWLHSLSGPTRIVLDVKK